MDKICHLFLPRSSNNHRAKILQPSGISTIISLFLVFQITLTGLGQAFPSVLGFATNITVPDLINLSNEKRLQNGAAVLKINDQLSAAAKAKADDMFAENYWAHTSPSGKDPWGFIIAAGYTYLYAGENLARDFSDSRGVVEAWMNSASHRENLVNPRYDEVGFAVVNGKLNGEETTIVVQEFGTKQKKEPAIAAGVNSETSVASIAAQNAPPKIVEVQPSSPESVEVIAQNNSLPIVAGTKAFNFPVRLDAFAITRATSLGIIILLLGVFVLDTFLVYRRRTVRLSGHAVAHMMLLFVLLAVLNLVGRGRIL